ncbi:hypothetical protein DZF91_25960, partial [Actinomadura logoneensis]
ARSGADHRSATRGAVGADGGFGGVGGLGGFGGVGGVMVGSLLEGRPRAPPTAHQLRRFPIDTPACRVCHPDRGRPGMARCGQRDATKITKIPHDGDPGR